MMYLYILGGVVAYVLAGAVAAELLWRLLGLADWIEVYALILLWPVILGCIAIIKMTDWMITLVLDLADAVRRWQS